jgi:tetratricopeptide (TPR) repeat protein
LSPSRSEKIDARLAEESRKRRNQLLLFLFAVCVIVGIYLTLGPDTTGPAPGGGAETASGGIGSISIEGVPAEELLKQQEERKTPAEETRAILAEYQEKIEAEPDSADAPALLNASGNLYKQKFRDFAKAAEQYEMLLAQYPEYEAIARVYPELATCYEQLGETGKLQGLYREMMDRFPPETAEHQWAADKLGLQVEPVPAPDESLDFPGAVAPEAAPEEPATTP